MTQWESDFRQDCWNLQETKDINAQLLRLYHVWMESWYSDDKNRYDPAKLGKPELLTCTDSYLENRVMLFGREAHDTKNKISQFPKALEDFDNPNSYNYYRMIKNGEADNTLFLRTRKLCADPSGKDFDFKKFTSVLVNNLNKVSYRGKYTPVTDDLNAIYSEFIFDGEKKNIFYHEFRILKPKKIIFLCGKGYVPHIKRDFGEPSFHAEVAEKISASVQEFSLRSENPVPISPAPAEFTFSSQGTEDYTVQYICGYHPNAHMRKNVREQYDEAIKTFVEK